MIPLRGYDVAGEIPNFAPTSQVRSRVPITEGVVSQVGRRCRQSKPETTLFPK